MAINEVGLNWSALCGRLRQHLDEIIDQSYGFLREVVGSVRGVLHASEAGLLVPTGSTNELRFLISVNSSPELERIVSGQLVPCDQSMAGYAFLTGHLIARTRQGEDHPEQFYSAIDKMTGLTTIHYVALPLITGGHVLGVATFVNRSAGYPDEPFNQHEIHSAQAAVPWLITGLHNWHRLELHKQWMEAELSDIEQLAEQTLKKDGFPDTPRCLLAVSRPPELRALAAFERLTERHQELAADILERLADGMGE